jgi:cell wall-associated NlpC family hydrolase/exonuclease VII small subunit
MPTAARLTTLVLVLVATLALAGAVGADPDKIDAKRAEAEQVLAQIHALDMELEHAIEAWNGANLRLEQLEGQLALNQERLEIAKESLSRARTTVDQRLVELYQGGEIDVVEVMLGATSFDDLLDGLDTASRVAEDDARILDEVRRSKAEVERQRQAIERSLARQREIVAERAARRDEIEQGLAERRALYDSVREEIAVLEEQERQRQARLAAQARRQAAAIERRQAEAEERQTARESGGGQAEQADQEPAPAAAPAPSPKQKPKPKPSPAPSPPPAGPGHPEVVSIALRYLGVPYRWGGASPSGFDCSGFTMFVYGKIGISLPHLVSWQYGYGRQVSRSQLAAGDLVFFNGLGHVGIYIGGGRFVHAPHTGDVVKISSIWDSWYRSSWVGARRL